MTSNSVELVRNVYEAWNNEGLEGLEPWLAETVELIDAPEMPDARSWHGREEVLGRLAEVSAAMGGGWADLRDFRAFGDEVLVAMVWQSDAKAGSAAFGDVFHVVEVNRDEIARIRVYVDEASALLAIR